MQQPNILPMDMLGRIRALALEQVQLMDQLEAALKSGNQDRVNEIARQLVSLEREIVQR